MATHMVTCDVCGVALPVAQSYRDIGGERDLCALDYFESELLRAKEERQRLVDWLERTHLEKLRELMRLSILRRCTPPLDLLWDGNAHVAQAHLDRARCGHNPGPYSAAYRDLPV